MSAHSVPSPAEDLFFTAFLMKHILKNLSLMARLLLGISLVWNIVATRFSQILPRLSMFLVVKLFFILVVCLKLGGMSIMPVCKMSGS